MLVNLAILHRVLRDDELVPFFQPLVDVRSGELLGFEILARWQHAQLGAILPENLIRLAEEHDLIDDLMEQVLCKAFVACRELPEHLRLAVNVSPVQLNGFGLPQRILGCVEQTGFAMSRLTIELTETTQLDDLTHAREIVESLQSMGCRMSLDDFGTGFSLLHLHALPFDRLKIDRSHVAKIVGSPNAQSLVAGILSLAKSMKLLTIGEGIETAEQADTLLGLGCEVGQGWLYGRPEPEANLGEMVERRFYRPAWDGVVRAGARRDEGVGSAVRARVG